MGELKASGRSARSRFISLVTALALTLGGYIAAIGIAAPAFAYEACANSYTVNPGAVCSWDDSGGSTDFYAPHVLVSEGGDSNWGAAYLNRVIGQQNSGELGVCLDPGLHWPDNLNNGVRTTLIGTGAGPTADTTAKIAYILNKYLTSTDSAVQGAMAIYIRQLAHPDLASISDVTAVLAYNYGAGTIQQLVNNMAADANLYAGLKNSVATIDLASMTVTAGLRMQGPGAYVPGYSATITLSNNVRFSDTGTSTRTFTTASSASSWSIVPATTLTADENVTVAVQVNGIPENSYVAYKQNGIAANNEPYQMVVSAVITGRTRSLRANDNERAEGPALQTTAVDAADVDHYLPQSGGTITDTVAYTGLTPDRAYRMVGQLMNESGQAVGSPVSVNFTASSTGDGTMTMDLPVTSAQALAASQNGGKLVVFETLYDANGTPAAPGDDVEVGSHEDLTDAGQTVLIPSIGTTAIDQADSDHVLPDTGGTIVDTVVYSNVEPDAQYTLTGQLMDKATNTPIGSPVSQTVTASATGSGTWTLVFPATDAAHAGKQLVAFETLFEGVDVEFAWHRDITDFSQTVGQAKIGTTATDAADGDHFLPQAGGTITDTVAYDGLEPDAQYTLTGQLKRRDGTVTGENVGGPVSQTVTASSTGSGTWTMSFTVPAQTYAGESLVVFESLYDSHGEYLTKHEDINDQGQTVAVADVHTTALDQDDQDHYLTQGRSTITDTVAYTGLIPNHSYEVIGELMIKDGTATGTSTGITVTATLTSDEDGEGIWVVDFEIPAEEFAGQTLVVFESVVDLRGTVATDDDQEVAVHHDIDDEAQSVYIPQIGTTLVDGVDGDHYFVQPGGVVKDTVEYTNLKPGATYTVKGELISKTTGQPTGIKGEAAFTADEDGSGTVVVDLIVPADVHAGDSLVAFEELYDASNKLTAWHENPEDEDQTVIVPKIGTTAIDKLDGDRYLVQSGGTIVDTVAYEGLEPGETYTLAGELVDKATGEPTGIVGQATFVASETGDGTATVEFVVPSDEQTGVSLVVFERLYDVTGRLTASHEDTDDEDQTVVVPKIGTTATDKADGDHYLPETGGTIVDTIAYQGLIPGDAYTVAGELMDKQTRRGTGIKATATFVASQAGSGTVLVEFVVPAGHAGASLVVFERLYDADSRLWAWHEDFTDEDQTVELPRIRTTATDKSDGDHELAAGGGIVLDTVTYKGLAPGVTYVVTGELMDKQTGAGTGITTAAWFVAAESGSGEVAVEFVVPSGYAGMSLVAFEKLYQSKGTIEDISDDVLTATHEDLTDEDQTVVVSLKLRINSGEGANAISFGRDSVRILGGIVLLLVAGIGAAIWMRRREPAER